MRVAVWSNAQHWQMLSQVDDHRAACGQEKMRWDSTVRLRSMGRQTSWACSSSSKWAWSSVSWLWKQPQRMCRRWSQSPKFVSVTEGRTVISLAIKNGVPAKTSTCRSSTARESRIRGRLSRARVRRASSITVRGVTASAWRAFWVDFSMRAPVQHAVGQNYRVP